MRLVTFSKKVKDVKDEWKELYDKYEKRKRRIIIRILLVTIAIIIISGMILSLYSFEPSIPQENKNLSTDSNLQKINSDLSGAVSPGSYKMQTDVPDTQCFWIRSTTNENGFVLEVREYNSSSKNCIGEFLNKTEILLDKPINLIGNDCICGKKICELENVLENNITNLRIKGC